MVFIVAGQVFPTHVGVFPSLYPGATLFLCIPHTCGGVSWAGKSGFAQKRYSPHMWGCSQSVTLEDLENLNIPHICGGVPFVL